MNIYQKWQEILNNQTQDTFEPFWAKYSETEKNIYTYILKNYQEAYTGTFKDLVAKHETTNELFMGFLDGINSSLKEELNLNEITEDSEISLNIDFEKLYYNMLEAKADYLYTLPQWADIFSQEKLNEITKAQKASKTVVKDKKIGRNEPCPCGSGKKYKKCCGINDN